ncbi:hypothetical protein NDU88_004193 [Pleurodeles waltl]|uniref:Uncharacterized protein n=1 Tax=Pleurodeles waltl TaxID=8319 RepID=A0AAV7M7M6_PLEWA|nr:hypothetical protein NDU88_004193 [Pleurodeles waltl]
MLGAWPRWRREQQSVRENCRLGLRSYSAAPANIGEGAPEYRGCQEDSGAEGSGRTSVRKLWGPPGRGLSGPGPCSWSAGTAVRGGGRAVRPRGQRQGVEPIEERFSTVAGQVLAAAVGCRARQSARGASEPLEAWVHAARRSWELVEPYYRKCPTTLVPKEKRRGNSQSSRAGTGADGESGLLR